MLKRLTGKKTRNHGELKERMAFERYCSDICYFNCYTLQENRYVLDLGEKYIDPILP